MYMYAFISDCDIQVDSGVGWKGGTITDHPTRLCCVPDTHLRKYTYNINVRQFTV